MESRVGGLQTSEYWRERADEARRRTDQMQDSTAKSIMLEIVQKYEAMAELAARREASWSRP
jgi:hypothetical protein